MLNLRFSLFARLLSYCPTFNFYSSFALLSASSRCISFSCAEWSTFTVLQIKYSGLLHRMVYLTVLSLVFGLLLLAEPEALLTHTLNTLLKELQGVSLNAKTVETESNLLAAQSRERSRNPIDRRWAHRVRRRPRLAQEVDRLSEDELDFLTVSALKAGGWETTTTGASDAR